MRLDFWNNPIVVSAFRVKYRRGSPGIWTALYVTGLLGLGGLLHYYQANLPIPWFRAYLVAILGIQFLVSAVYSLYATQQSMRSEVLNRTLDFQRIAALSPHDLLLGKLLGEPAVGYLCALATIPLAVLCASLGATSLPVLLLIYLCLMTTGLLSGSVGLVQTLTSANTARQWSGGGLITLLIVLGVLFLPSVIFNAGNLPANSTAALLCGSFTPILTIHGIAVGEPWVVAQFWSVAIPYLWIAPLAQLALAAIVFQAVARRLASPAAAPLSKPQLYVLLLVIDFIAAGLIFDPTPLAPMFEIVTARFFLTHLLVSLTLINWVTPIREVLKSWIWRYRGHKPWLLDTCWGERSENTGVVFAAGLIGLFSYVTMVWLPLLIRGQVGPQSLLDPTVVTIAASTMLLLAAGAVTYQWFVVAAGKAGKTVFWFFGALLVLFPAFVGLYFGQVAPELLGQKFPGEARLAYSFSPLPHYAAWLSDPREARLAAPLWVTYGLILLGSWYFLRRRITRLARIVNGKLALMGVNASPDPADDAAVDTKTIIDTEIPLAELSETTGE